MKVLLDTCVLSEIRHPGGNEAVKRAVQACSDDDIFVSVISLGEIFKGVSLLERSSKKRELLSWLRNIIRSYSDHILPIDLEISQIWGELTASAQQGGKTVGTSDGLIAATAIRHGLHVMTCNVSDFESAGALISNPWGAL